MLGYRQGSTGSTYDADAATTTVQRFGINVLVEMPYNQHRSIWAWACPVFTVLPSFR
jgi:hypothetical protein